MPIDTITLAHIAPKIEDDLLDVDATEPKIIKGNKFTCYSQENPGRIFKQSLLQGCLSVFNTEQIAITQNCKKDDWDTSRKIFITRFLIV